MAQHQHTPDGNEHGRCDDAYTQQNGNGGLETLILLGSGCVFVDVLGHGTQSFPVRLE
jgi:hypothetical protein